MESNCPYHGLPDRAVWRQSVGRRAVETIFPVDGGCEPIAPGTRVATAGSCFAQRIAANVGRLGLEHFVTEPGPKFLSPEARQRLGYGTYSARYGNVYTAIQLVQLLERAYGLFEPVEEVWRRDERFVDPFRAGLPGSGFVSVAECLEDRRSHLAAVRAAVEGASVFVFTLGLTETWRSRRDGAVFPVCPGCGHGGSFDAERYEFVEFGVADVTAHVGRFVELARRHNPRLRIVLTVSPVPLIATFGDRHVLTATVGAKSVLRAACDEVRRHHRGVDYFPAYEIVQVGGPAWAFAPDRRAVTPAAVAHIVDCFAIQFGLDAHPATPAVVVGEPPLAIPRPQVVCDEDTILAAMAAGRETR